MSGRTCGSGSPPASSSVSNGGHSSSQYTCNSDQSFLPPPSPPVPQLWTHDQLQPISQPQPSFIGGDLTSEPQLPQPRSSALQPPYGGTSVYYQTTSPVYSAHLQCPYPYPHQGGIGTPSINCDPIATMARDLTSVEAEFGFHATKRRKVDTSDVEVISLLSDDEEDAAMTTVPLEKKTTSQKKSVIGSVISRDGFPLPPDSPDSGLAMEPLIGSTIRQHSNTPQPAESTPQAKRNISYSMPSSSPSTAYHAALPDESTYSNRMLTPPPSSSLEPEPVPPGQLRMPATANVEEPPLCPEQARLVELIASGQNVFYTGSAGCGKSTVLKAFTKRLREMGKNVRIVAPTGRAALQVNGSTTWTYAGWTPDHHKRTLAELKEAAHGRFVWKRFRETDVLVIDEISMVENLHFERLNAVMKEARYKPYPSVQPAFGGVQVVVTGDFCQLPPVKPFQHCIECGFGLTEKKTATGKVHVCKRHGEYRDEDKWAFRSEAWKECNFVHVHLNTIHRQNDETFIRILQKCRIGRELSQADTDLLMDHKCMVHHATRLFATREEVGNVNRHEFERLKTVNHTYWCLDNFVWQRDAHPHLGWKSMRKPKSAQSEGPLRALEDHRFDECVQLKKGMLVVLLVNLDLEMGLCNGSQGIICGFEKSEPKKLPQAKVGKNDPQNKIFGDRAPLKENQIKKFIQDPGAKYKTWPIVRFHNGQVRTIYADCSITELGDERPYSLLMRTQIPLAPAWAMTIHKSQSLTLDRVIVNLSRAFEEGQVYVALSRATGLQGLKIEGDAKGLLAGLGGNKEVQKFLRDNFGDLDNVLSSQA